jgi:hypothetical protein
LVAAPGPRYAARPRIGEHHLYDLADDPDEERNRSGESAEPRMIELLRAALASLDAPGEQYQRLGIA